MVSPDPIYPLVVIAGPTASGKSHLALHVAQTFQGEIVGCDSVQVYRGFDIGSAKTPPSQRRSIPHHLIDVADPRQVFSAGDYLRLGRDVLADIRTRGTLPVVVGGTGFYLRALLHGLFESPKGRDEILRSRLHTAEQNRPGLLHRFLRRIDQDAAARIHMRDTQKIIRALEVSLTSGRPLTEMHEQGREPLHGFRIMSFLLDPPRVKLRERIAERSAGMLRIGLVEEVRTMLAAGVPRSAKPFEAIGYAQALRVLDGSLSEPDAIAEITLRTGQYAKRQMTWFRKETGMTSVPGFGDDSQVISLVEKEIKRFLTER